jgi:hypothetical protein
MKDQFYVKQTCLNKNISSTIDSAVENRAILFIYCNSLCIIPHVQLATGAHKNYTLQAARNWTWALEGVLK